MRVLLLILFLILFIFYIPHSVSASTIKLNEFYAAGGNTSSNPDWVEVYYSGVNITLYKLIDAAGNTKNLSGGSYDGNFATVDWSNRLNNNGDTIKLALIITPDSPVDQVTYGGSGDISTPNSGQSAGRNPDGTGNWTMFSTPSKGSTNNTLPTSTPSPTPTPTPSPAPTSSTSPPISSFTLSNVPSQINSDQSFNVSVNLTLPDNPNTNFYLKGAFKKADRSNYFGQTLVSGNWVKNSSTYSNQYPITTNSSGNWSGNLEVKADPDDSGYTGTDDYIFKVGRYNSTDTNPSVSWSDNESTIKIISTESSDQGSTSISTSNNPSATTFPFASSQSVKSQAITSSQPKSYNRLVYRIASVAAASTSATPSAKVEVSNQKQTNPIVWIGLIFIFAGVGLIGYIYLKRNRHGKIPI